MTTTPTTSGYDKPLPKPTAIDAKYWEALKRHELNLPKCKKCGHLDFPPRLQCPKCLAEEFEWVKLSGRAKLWSWVVFYQRYFASFQKDIPYVVAFVELAEGPRMMSTVVDCPQDKLKCDMPLQVVFEDVTPETTIPKFRPA